MKVFLSHSTKDGEFVKLLAAALTSAGFEPWLCEIDIEKNDNFVAKMEEGLKTSDVALLLWSPEAAASKWTTEEWTSVLSRQVKEERTRLGIVLLRDCPLPELLRTKNYIRVRDDQQAAIAEIIDWLKHRETAQRLSGLQAPVYLPDYRPQDFIGRTALLEQLRNTFTTEPTVFLLYGEPGSGKSLLALQFAWDAQKDFDAVIFQTCGQRSLDTITAELAARLPIDVKILPPEQQREAAKTWLRQRESLLVLDDVWSGDVKQLEPGPACSVLYTSRQQSLPWIAAKQSAQVEKFSDTECDALFHSALDDTFGADEVTAQRDVLLGFAKKVDSLPIAVAVGASLLRQKSATRLERGVLKLRLEALNDGLHDVNALFAKAIESQPEREQKLLAACAICVQEGFWLPLAASTAELSEDDSDDAADALVHASLLRVIDRNRQRFQLHALLRDQLLARLGESGVKPFQQRQALALEALFNNWETRWKDCRECLDEIVPASARMWNDGERDRHITLTNHAFLLAQRIGALEAALQILDLGVQLRAGATDELNQRQLETLYGNMAGVLRTRGQAQQAWDVLDKQEAICVPLNYADGLQRCYGAKAVLLRDRGEFKEAYVLLKQQEAICDTLPDPQRKKGLALCYRNQGLILKDWGHAADAMALYKKEEGFLVDLNDQVGLQCSYGNQALILMDPGPLHDETAAMKLLQDQETICAQKGIQDDLQRCYGNQAVLLQRQDQPEKALDLYRKKEAICVALGNQDGLQVSYGNRAMILEKMGLFDDAIDLYKKKEAICLALGRKSSLGYCYWNWGKLALDRGDKSTAADKLTQARNIFNDLGMMNQRYSVQVDLDKMADP